MLGFLILFCLVIFVCDQRPQPGLLGEAIEEYVSCYFVDGSLVQTES